MLNSTDKIQTAFPPFSVFAQPGLGNASVAQLLLGPPPGIRIPGIKQPDKPSDQAERPLADRPIADRQLTDKHDDVEPATQQKVRSAVCANCGLAGHYYRECKLPIASYGIVCYRLKVDFNTSCIRPEFLLVQRRDSLFWIEFIRGKYDETDKAYLVRMIEGMTADEQQYLRNNTPFADLWAKLWTFSNLRNCMTNEFMMSRDKYAALKAGSAGVPLADIVKSVTNALPYLDWTFPRGRRALHESEADCALREFVEETGLPANSLHMYNKTIDDTYVGSNGVNYSHTYFLARQIRGGSAAQDLPIRSQSQAREISHVRWMTLEEASKKLVGTSAKILERAHRLVVQSLVGSW